MHDICLEPNDTTEVRGLKVSHESRDAQGLRIHTNCCSSAGWWCHELKGVTRCRPLEATDGD